MTVTADTYRLNYTLHSIADVDCNMAIVCNRVQSVLFIMYASFTWLQCLLSCQCAGPRISVQWCAMARLMPIIGMCNEAHACAVLVVPCQLHSLSLNCTLFYIR